MTISAINTPATLARILGRRKPDTASEPTCASFADLCKTLSAKVMPRSVMFSAQGTEATDGKALDMQRRNRRAAK